MDFIKQLIKVTTFFYALKDKILVQFMILNQMVFHRCKDLNLTNDRFFKANEKMDETGQMRWLNDNSDIKCFEFMCLQDEHHVVFKYNSRFPGIKLFIDSRVILHLCNV